MVSARLISLLSALAAAAASHGDIAYNNYGSGDSYDANNYRPVGGTHDFWYWAMQFTSATSGPVSKITLALTTGCVYDVSIAADVGGLPGGALESWQAGDLNYQDKLILTGNGSASLSAGNLYWVTVGPHNVGFDAGSWFMSNSAVGLTAFHVDTLQGPWEPFHGRLAALRVETVPEPETYLVLGGGAIVALNRRRKTGMSRRNAV